MPSFTIHSVSVNAKCIDCVLAYTALVPKLWNDTIEAHRREVRDAILDATAALVTGHGLTAVTMSQIAEDTGIGRATLYKYFPDVEAILVAWHERHVSGHLEHLSQLATQTGSTRQRLGAVLEAYALIMHHRTSASRIHPGPPRRGRKGRAGQARCRARRAGQVLPSRLDRRRWLIVEGGGPTPGGRHSRRTGTPPLTARRRMCGWVWAAS